MHRNQSVHPILINNWGAHIDNWMLHIDFKDAFHAILYNTV